eukprot:2195703-Pleurochrysis_carterae.AAC.1
MEMLRLLVIVNDLVQSYDQKASHRQRDTVATDESAADRRADAQIDRSFSASHACKYIDGKLTLSNTSSELSEHNKKSGASRQQFRTAALAATVAARAAKRRWAPKI